VKKQVEEAINLSDIREEKGEEIVFTKIISQKHAIRMREMS
jgi:hypothetical protein